MQCVIAILDTTDYILFIYLFEMYTFNISQLILS